MHYCEFSVVSAAEEKQLFIYFINLFIYICSILQDHSTYSHSHARLSQYD